ncbi:MAG TPA: glycerol-3-phosphate dehydrogenase/oxidase [Chthonomonadaceae bacterium]|nr:glycerol-3-phosphate dehydrogenase/oxidase [Chthonomonadaceae bacterium]
MTVLRRERLAGGAYDLLVIGGGIVGAGVARDAAMRGLRTLLVEQADFASGTSSRSSRLLHGGLRYLAQGRIGLVREASVEKMTLSRIAPHLCSPLAFDFPVWRGAGPPLWLLSLGVRAYDLLCGGRNLDRSETLRPDRLAERLPGIRTEGLVGGTRHFDGITNDSRLAIDTLRSAEASGATVRNYTTFVSCSRTASGWECELRDELTGTPARVTATVAVNAAGAWASRFPQSAIRLRLTKGVHLVIDRRRLSVEDAAILTEGDRILFVIPWGERVILGTTDTDFRGDPAIVRASRDDVAYILRVVDRAFPAAKVSAEDVIAAWAGVRPLVAGSDSEGAPSDVSRGHAIRVTQPGWIDVAGGKLTTYRLMAEQAVDLAGRAMGRRLPRSTTSEQRIEPGRFSGVLPPAVDEAVVVEACRNEWAVHLDDVLLRRTSWYGYHGAESGIPERAAEWMARQLGWSAAELRDEVERFRAAVRMEY